VTPQYARPPFAGWQGVIHSDRGRGPSRGHGRSPETSGWLFPLPATRSPPPSWKTGRSGIRPARRCVAPAPRPRATVRHQLKCVGHLHGSAPAQTTCHRGWPLRRSRWCAQPAVARRRRPVASHARNRPLEGAMLQRHQSPARLSSRTCSRRCCCESPHEEPWSSWWTARVAGLRYLAGAGHRRVSRAAEKEPAAHGHIRRAPLW